MGQKLVIGPFSKGLKNDLPAFAIDNTSFPTLVNAYQWRGRIKRKRGTEFLGRLRRLILQEAIDTAPAGGSTYSFNIKSLLSLETDSSLQPGNVEITIGALLTVQDDGSGGWTQTAGTATLNTATSTINYQTGAVTLNLSVGAFGSEPVDIDMAYFPNLPVMGLEDDEISEEITRLIAFDTTYSYNVANAGTNTITNTNFYKNPASGEYTNYIQKAADTEFTWNGQDYQQFWSDNYQGAVWVTNGVTVPFSITNIGMQFRLIENIINIVAGPPATADITITNHGLEVGDFVFINEVVGATGINFQTGYVTTVVNANTVTVTFPSATLGGAYSSGGIAQYLTNTASPSKDCLRWYDGNPRTGNQGWVNFCPPLSKSNFSVSELPVATYYLCGAKIILNYKDRLLFIGPVVQTSGDNSQIYLRDTVIYSENGTPYYTASFTGDDPELPNVLFDPILTPINETAIPASYFEDTAGFGGYVQTGANQPINAATKNEDAVLLGNSKSYSRLVYTSNDLLPFQIYKIDSELGSSGPFGTVNLGESTLTRGERGLVQAIQTSVDRFDLDIPDAVFQMNLRDNGPERITAQRDFMNEWIYFSYPINNVDDAEDPTHLFNTASLYYNYRDRTWALFYESYTHYGQFFRQTGLTWETLPYDSWTEWTDPWNSGETTVLQPDLIAGNQQGFIVFKDEGLDESPSLFIEDISTNTITSPAHCLNEQDFIIIQSVLGTVSSQVNGKIFQVTNVTADTFDLSPPITGGTYLGNGTIVRLYRPYIQTKQFPVWNDMRKVRLGAQMYLLSATNIGQIQLLIFLSTNADSAYNGGPIIPDLSSVNDSLIYKDILYTCPESTNLGLTPANINLQQVTAIDQDEIWHRFNTSLIGDVVQVGFSLSDDQMRTYTENGDPFTITAISQANPCVITVNNTIDPDELVLIENVEGMVQINTVPGVPNSGVYLVISSTPTSITIDLDSSGFSAYTDGGTATLISAEIQTSEIEILGIILDINQSMLLS